ncbi:MAG TPA: tellurium resistance protein [Pseudonocardiaceae bacterium]|nr:tellurium resistance protein [Pseudonocardiaceae bacterium]
MPIEYTKPQSGPPVSLSKVTLTKNAPVVSLTKQATTGLLRVNLNWTTGKPGLFRQSRSIDLDLGCLYEFTDGTKGVVQALGNSFTASPRGVRDRVIRLDGDDRSGSNSAGENLFVDLSYANQIKRILVFAFIYEGVANWAAADGVVTLFPVAGPQIEVRLDDARHGSRTCGIAMLESNGAELSVRREVQYVQGPQSQLDRLYGWGLTWQPGRK